MAGMAIFALTLMPLARGRADVPGLSSGTPNPKPTPRASDRSPGYTRPDGVNVLTFEGLADQEAVNEFYNGGFGGNGSGPGPDLDISFTTNSLALIDADAGGSGNFGGEPSPDTILFFTTGTAVMNVPNGFTTGFSFFYTAILNPGVVNVYDGPNATGNLLASIALPLTPNSGAPDPTGTFSPLVPIGVTFVGTARSIDFGGTVNQIGFDDITVGSSTPGGGGPDYDICCVDDATGDQLLMVVENAEPGSEEYGRWEYRRNTPTGVQVICGRAEYLQYRPGLSIVARDNQTADNPEGCTTGTLQMQLDYPRNKCTATVTIRGTTSRFVLRDRNLLDNECGGGGGDE